MKGKMPPLKKNSPDDYQTPPYAIKPLLPFIKEDSVIWECAAGNGNLVKAFEKKGFCVISTDINRGADFLSYDLDTSLYEIIITNPPFSLKYEFLKHAYELQKPFAFLLPLTTLESQRRQRLYKKYGLEILLFDKRISFEKPGVKHSGGSWFATAWFTWGLDIGNQLTFVELEKDTGQILFGKDP